jgi:iron-sulfur cluster assembly protein
MTSPPISVTDEAIDAIEKTIRTRGLGEKPCLRFGIQSGGCSGISYQLGFDAETKTDVVFEFKGIRFAIDDEHLVFLRGTQISYVINEMGGLFRFDNPNARHTCPCGTSFNIV